jgi:aryl-alcohol dehydrogenase-like predicted oxidoreductase
MSLFLKSTCVLGLLAGSVRADSMEGTRCASEITIDRMWQDQSAESAETILRKRAVVSPDTSHLSWIRAIPEPAIHAIIAGIGFEAFGAWRMRRRKHCRG